MARKSTNKSETARLQDMADSKKGYIRYLQNQLNNPAGIQSEIARHKEHIATHQKHVDRLEELQSSLPGALAQASADLKELNAQINALYVPTKSDLEDKLAALTARLAKLEAGN